MIICPPSDVCYQTPDLCPLTCQHCSIFSISLIVLDNDNVLDSHNILDDELLLNVVVPHTPELDPFQLTEVITLSTSVSMLLAIFYVSSAIFSASMLLAIFSSSIMLLMKNTCCQLEGEIVSDLENHSLASISLLRLRVREILCWGNGKWLSRTPTTDLTLQIERGPGSSNKFTLG